mgnify:CR=1 FL=1
MMKRKSIFLFLLLFGAVLQSAGQSYISRLWNTKKYAEIIEYSPKGQSLSGQDNVLIKKSGLSPTFLFGAVAVKTVALQRFKGFTCFGVLRLHTVEQQSEVTRA